MSASGDECLRLAGVHAYYGESHILHGVDLSVKRGEVVTLLGRNGAGRTTTLKTILGLVGRRTGSVLINGVEAVNLPPHRIAQLGIGYCPEERGIFASLSAEENSRRRRPSGGWKPSRPWRNSAPASSSPCTTWKSAAPARCSANRRAATEAGFMLATSDNTIATA